MNIYCRHCGECHPKYACKKSVSILSTQCDILSTPAEIKSDDAEVAALMMEADITAPIKEQCEENARLMREITQLKAQRNADAAQYKAIGAELAKITMLEIHDEQLNVMRVVDVERGYTEIQRRLRHHIGTKTIVDRVAA